MVLGQAENSIVSKVCYKKGPYFLTQRNKYAPSELIPNPIYFAMHHQFRRAKFAKLDIATLTPLQLVFIKMQFSIINNFRTYHQLDYELKQQQDLSSVSLPTNNLVKLFLKTYSFKVLTVKLGDKELFGHPKSVH